MPFWLLVLMIVTLIALCWGSGYGVYYLPDRRGVFPGGLLGILGLIWCVILIILFVVGIPGSSPGLMHQ